jgi:hypothetical protein
LGPAPFAHDGVNALLREMGDASTIGSLVILLVQPFPACQRPDGKAELAPIERYGDSSARRAEYGATAVEPRPPRPDQTAYHITLILKLVTE